MQVTNLLRRWPKTTKQSAIYRTITHEFCGILSHMVERCVEVTGQRRHCKLLCRGMEIPCRLVLSCSSKVKINRLKELLDSKIH